VHLWGGGRGAVVSPWAPWRALACWTTRLGSFSRRAPPAVAAGRCAGPRVRVRLRGRGRVRRVRGRVRVRVRVRGRLTSDWSRRMVCCASDAF
jgi:hypothetical protein